MVKAAFVNRPGLVRVEPPVRALVALSILGVLLASPLARAQAPAGSPPPSGPPPAITPEHQAQVRAQLEQESRAAQGPGIYAQEARDVDAARYQAWVARGKAAKRGPFRLGDRLSGVDTGGYFAAYGGRDGLFAIGSRVAGRVGLWRWLELEGRAYVASEVFQGFHFVTTAAVLSMRAEVAVSGSSTLYATLGAGAEAPLTGGARTPDGALLVPLSLGVSACIVNLGDAGCGGIMVESTFGIRVPFGGADEMRIVRGYVAFNFGPALVF